MPAPLSREARRITLYLFEDDCQQFEARYGRGWTEQVRLLVEKNCKEYRRLQAERDASYCKHGLRRDLCDVC